MRLSNSIFLSQFSYRRQRIQGFTLVELLVVIAIIGILVGLLLPAVQAAREAARRMQCSNHVRQMALAFHNHQDSKRHLPGGGRDGNPINEGLGACCRSKTQAGFTWLYHILPYIEQTNIYELASGKDPTQTGDYYNTGENLVARSFAPIFNCPSRRSNAKYGSNPATATYRADYAGNAGIRKSDVGPRGGKPSDGSRGVVRQIDSAGWKITIEQIKDGSSNTLMIGEKALNSLAFNLEGGDNEIWNNAGWDEDVIRYGAIHNVTGNIFDGLPPIADSNAPKPEGSVWIKAQTKYGDLFDQWHPFFGSSHTGGMNAGLADGSVQFLSSSIDSQVMRRLSLVDDGETVTLP